MKITKEAFALAEQYWKARLANDMEELEELLITSDIGVQTSMDLIEGIAKKSSKISTPDQLKETLKSDILTYLDRCTLAPEQVDTKPHVIMVVGVNGSMARLVGEKLALVGNQLPPASVLLYTSPCTAA